MKNKS